MEDISPKLIWMCYWWFCNFGQNEVKDHSHDQTKYGERRQRHPRLLPVEFHLVLKKYSASSNLYQKQYIPSRCTKWQCLVAIVHVG